MTGQKSYRQILKSSSIIGGASVLNIVIGLLRIKVLAVLLGPAGIAVMALYTSIMSTASTLAGMGLGSSGVRQLAASKGEEGLAQVRKALFYGNLSLGLLGMLVLWAVREPVARWVFGDVSRVADVGWLGVGVLLTLIAGSQTALLQGLRRIGDLARVTVFSSVVSTIIGLSIIALLGHDGMVWFVLIVPGANILVASWYAAKLPRPVETEPDWKETYQQARTMLGLGVVFMITALATTLAELFVRSVVVRELGLESAGYFQAAWVISMQYIGFVLGAMGADYFPRLSKVIEDKSHSGRLVNEQTEVALLLAGPVFLAMLALAPWVVHLLYSANFTPAIDILRWQIQGDILKVASWPLGFILIARGEGKLFLFTELTWNAAYALVVWLGVQRFGLDITGIGFFACYALYLSLVFVITAIIHDFRWQAINLRLLAGLTVGAAVIHALSVWSTITAALVGLLMAAIMGVFSLHKLSHMVGLNHHIAGGLARLRTAIGLS